jgi:hypothetical protein
LSDPIPDEVLDRLYGAPAAEFVANRDAAARELKAAGHAATADAVRGLRRPTAPAVAINRAVRAEPAQARALLDAGADLRRAHEAVLAGDADREAVKAATGAERQAVNALAGTAARESAGGRASDDVGRRILETLEAVALDPKVRERFARGRLEKEARASGLPLDVPIPSPSRKRATKRATAAQAKRAAEQERRKREEAVRRAEEMLARRRREVEAGERARESADATLREARERLKEAKSNLRRARSAAERGKD